MHTGFTLCRRALVLAWLGLVLSASLGMAATPATLVADFDGDGQRDSVVLDTREPSLLHVWLSASGTVSTIRSSSAVICLTARDLDGDHRAELIGRGAQPGLLVWTHKKRGFRTFRPHRSVPGTLARPAHHKWDDRPVGDSSEWSGDDGLGVELVLSPSPRGPTRAGVASLACLASPLHSRRRLAPLSPRPPPAAI